MMEAHRNANSITSGNSVVNLCCKFRGTGKTVARVDCGLNTIRSG